MLALNIRTAMLPFMSVPDDGGRNSL